MVVVAQFYKMRKFIRSNSRSREVVGSSPATDFYFLEMFSNIYIILYILFLYFCKYFKYDKIWFPNLWQTEVTMKNYRENGAYPIARSLVQSPLRVFISWNMLYLLGKYTNIYKYKHYWTTAQQVGPLSGLYSFFLIIFLGQKSSWF